MAPHVRIRDASPEETLALESLQRRSSNVWAAYRQQLAAHPDAIELPRDLLDDGRVRVAVDDQDVAVGFSVVIPAADGACELDGLFVEPSHMRRGTGRALVEDAARRAFASGARRLEVTAGPAQGFYERLGFSVTEPASTRFGPAVRMRRDLNDE